MLRVSGLRESGEASHPSDLNWLQTQFPILLSTSQELSMVNLR